MTWQEQHAASLDFMAGELEKALVEIANLEAMLVTLDVPGLLTETRGYAGGIRALRNDLINEARELRRHQDVDVLPISLTTRNVRPG
jgi:hypothetical protein